MKNIILIIYACLLVSCATTYTPHTVLSWQQHQTQLNHMTQWTANGAISITEASERLSSNIYWQHQPKLDQIDLFGPMGLGANKIEITPSHIKLTDSQGNTHLASSPEQLIKEQLGLTLPVSNLRYWILGLPAPDTEHAETYDEFNRLKTLEQQGWTINYQEYMKTGLADLPQKLTLSQKEITTKIVISKWA